MTQSELQGPRAWKIRRAELIDVPAVARLLGVPHASQEHLLTGSSYPTIISATRLVLTHVALELGEFWVAVDVDNHALASVVLLPAGDGGQERLQLALRLELGLLLPPKPVFPARSEPASRAELEPGLGPISEPADPIQLSDLPEPHWLLLAAVPPGGELVLIELLAAAMPAVDASGLPVLSLQKGPPASAITAAGFEPLPTPPVVPAPVRLMIPAEPWASLPV